MNETAQVVISVIIVSWNVRERLERCLSSLASQRGVLAEIFVVDNASRDGSADLVQGRFPEVHLIRNSSNRGFAAACNQGLMTARGRVFLLLNPDTVLQSAQTLANAVRYLDTHEKIGILGGKILNEDGSVQRSVQRFPTLRSQALVLLKLHVLFPHLAPLRIYNMEEFSYEEEKDVDQVKGAFFVFTRTLFDRIGLLDKRFFAWFEEVDYCRRALDAGFRVRFTPSLSARHAGGASFRQMSSFAQQKMFTASMIKYFLKHRGIVPAIILSLCAVPGFVLSVFEPIVKPLLHAEAR